MFLLKPKMLLASITILALCACADKADQIAPSYVSPTIYNTMNCQQLAQEAQTVVNRATEASTAQDKKAKNDAVAVGVGAVLFWPALFFIKGDGAQSAEVARLKGEMNAIQQASTAKNCNIRIK